MDGDLIRARNILGVYLSFSVGLVLLFVFNELATDDVGTTILLGLSIFSIALLVLVISSLTSNWMGQTCDYKLQSALYSAGANMAGVVFIALALAVLGVDFSSLVIQIIIASGGTSVISSFTGSFGRDVPFAKSSDLDEDEYFASRIEPPQRSIPAAYEENGYEWLHLDEGTTWYRVGGGFPDPNNWELYKTS